MQNTVTPDFVSPATQSCSTERKAVSGVLCGRQVTIIFASKTSDDLLFRVKGQLANSYLNKNEREAG